MNLSPKTTGAVAGTTTAGAATVVLFYLLGFLPNFQQPSAEVVVAVTTLFTAIGALIGGYIPHSQYTPSPKSQPENTP